MTITTAELRDRVAEYLRIKAVDEDLADADSSKVERQILDATNELRELGLAWWADNAIPDACAFGMVQIVAAQLCTQFGKAGQGYEGGDAMGRARIASLKPSARIDNVRTLYY